MAKTNFQYEKRQRELEKKKKAEEKARKKLETKSTGAGDDGSALQDDEADVAGVADDTAAPSAG